MAAASHNARAGEERAIPSRLYRTSYDLTASYGRMLKAAMMAKAARRPQPHGQLRLANVVRDDGPDYEQPEPHLLVRPAALRTRDDARA